MPPAYLNNVPLIVSGDLGWQLTTGVLPHSQTFEVHPKHLQQLLLSGIGETELRIEGAHPLTVEKLTVLREEPGEDPHVRRVLVADRRWLWPYVLYSKSFNVRRATGRKRLYGERLEVVNTTDDQDYVEFSLKPPTFTDAWKATEVLRDILERLVGQQFTIDPQLAHRSIPVENLKLRDRGPRALERILDYFSVAGLYIDYDGFVVVYDRTTDQDKDLVDEGRYPRMQGGGWVREIDLSRLRGREVKVYLERLIEVRFDFDEGAPLPIFKRDRRVLQNVFRYPDYNLALFNGIKAEVNSWQDAEDCLDTWANDPTFPMTNHAGEKISLDKTLSLFPSHILQTAFVKGLIPATDEVQQRRVRAIMQHFRQTFRVRHEYMSRLEQIIAERAAVADYENRAHAPSPAYVDYCVRPTRRRLVEASLGQQDRILLAGNVTGYAEKLVDARVSPFEVQLVDPHLGVIHLAYRHVPYTGIDEVLPSKIESIPVATVAERVILTFEFTKLTSTHKLSTILSCVPGTPNDNRRFHEVRVTPQQVEQAYGIQLGACFGPTQEIFAGEELARFAWVDELESQIEEAIFEGAQLGQFTVEQEVPQQGTTVPRNPSTILVSSFLNEEDVNALALAQAAAYYFQLQDRFEGQYETALRRDFRPVGNVTSIEHQLTDKGGPVTRVVFPPARPPIDVFGLLPADVRARILGTVIRRQL